MAETPEFPIDQTVTSGYINGSDLLVAIGGSPVGHCTEHSVAYDSETKDRAVKAPETIGVSVSMFKETSVMGLSITISFKGLRCYDETEQSFEKLRTMWRNGRPVTVECYKRPALGVSAGKRNPYLKGLFVITKLNEGSTAADDASFDGELKLTGAPEVFDMAE